MKLLLKQTLVADPNSPYNGQVKDILIANGIIQYLGDSLEEAADKTISGNGITISPGWVDTFAHFMDPGYEYKETLETGAKAAAAGGFTTVFTLPNTQPVISNKVQVEYIVQKSRDFLVHILPLGAVTKDAEGKELAEMYDMRNSGAIAFSDGVKPVQTSGLFLKALQYVKAIDGVLIQVPVDDTIGRHGLMNEGITSTRLGLPGIPAVSEELIVARDIELTNYTGSKLHISGISTSKSVQLISNAKKAGINVSCSVTPYHLFFCDEDLEGYDTNLKVKPALRSREDVMALRQAVSEGLIDCIATHHLPQDWDNKVCEFEYAKDGMIGLESCFAVFNTLFPGMPVEQLIALLSTNAQTIFALEQSTVAPGNSGSFTIFERHAEYTFDRSCIKSKSTNSPFIGRSLKGKVIGIINKEKVYLT